MARPKTKTSLYRNISKDETRFFESRTKTLVIDGETWRRIPRPKPKSRADRRDDAVYEIEKAKSNIETAIGEIDDFFNLEEDERSEVVLNDTITIACNIDADVSEAVSECESLLDELQSWRDNLPESLSNSTKADMLDEAMGYLESAIDNLQIDVPDISENTADALEDLKIDLEEVVLNFEEAIDSLNSIEFPGMYN